MKVLRALVVWSETDLVGKEVMRQGGMSGLSASQSPRRRGTRKGLPSKRRKKVWTPSAQGQLASEGSSLERKHSLPERKSIAGQLRRV